MGNGVSNSGLDSIQLSVYLNADGLEGSLCGVMSALTRGGGNGRADNVYQLVRCEDFFLLPGFYNEGCNARSEFFFAVIPKDPLECFLRVGVDNGFCI